MAQRAKQASRRSNNASDTKALHKLSETSAQRLQVLERERDKALRDLAAAKARIAELESSRDQVVNRIDWVIDSLHSLFAHKT